MQNHLEERSRDKRDSLTGFTVKWKRMIKKGWPLILAAFFILGPVNCAREEDKDKESFSVFDKDKPAYGDMFIEASLGDA